VQVERDFDANAGTELKTEKLLAKSMAMLLVFLLLLFTHPRPTNCTVTQQCSWHEKMARLRSIMWLLQDVPRCAGPAGKGERGGVHGPLVLNDAVRMLHSRGQDGAILQRGTRPASRGDNGRQVGSRI